jgi:carboxyl-terminal processing protease
MVAAYASSKAAIRNHTQTVATRIRTRGVHVFVRFTLLFTLMLATATKAQAGAPNGSYIGDFDFYWQTIDDNFAYFDAERPRARWGVVRALYAPLAAKVTSKSGLIALLEKANNELYNGHLTLNVNLTSSNRIIPTGADMWAEPERGEFVIRNVRSGYNADRAGIRPGMIVVAVDGRRCEAAIRPFLPRSTTHYTRAMREYAINMLLAGRHGERRRITAVFHGVEREFQPDVVPDRVDIAGRRTIDVARLGGTIGYIKIDNSLGNTALISAFDRAIKRFRNARGLIIDLTDTPSGGNTTVVRAILGHFVRAATPYQEIDDPGEERAYGVRRAQLDLVFPRATRFDHPVAVLVNRWTGSVGEALAIGFSAATTDRVIGSKMAGLLGAICTYVTPQAGIGFAVPCERTFTVDGRPREDFTPSSGSGELDDLVLAERYLARP